MTRRRLVVLVIGAVFVLSLCPIALCWHWPASCARVQEWLALNLPSEDCAGLTLPLVIAHAGGRVDHLTYTNSLEALNGSYQKGCRVFELDFEWTSDKELVLLHDWNATATRIFGADFGGRWHNRDDFLAAGRLDGLTSLDLESLVCWLDQHPGALVVTDVKGDNLSALVKMKQSLARSEYRLIPQIYAFDEYEPVEELGFERIVLTLYRSHATDADVLAFVRVNRVSAVAMPVKRAYHGLPEALGNLGVPALVHTVNSHQHAKRLMRLGVYGIYTDDLYACGGTVGGFSW